MPEPEFVKVLARDVVPYLYGVWSSVADGDPFAVQPYHTEDGALEWRPIGSGQTEAEALVASLEAAPDDQTSELNMRAAHD